MKNVKFDAKMGKIGSRIQVVGDAGVGKTEFVIKMACDVMAEGMDVIYFNTDTKEDVLLKRLEGFIGRSFKGVLHMFTCFAPEEGYLKDCFSKAIMCAEHPVGMVIYDMYRSTPQEEGIIEFMKGFGGDGYGMNFVIVSIAPDVHIEEMVDSVYRVFGLSDEWREMVYGTISFRVEKCTGNGDFKAFNNENKLDNGMTVYTYTEL